MTFCRFRRLPCVFLWLALLPVALPAQPSTVPAPVDDGLDLRFANGIAAVVENKVITVDDIRREIAPLVPRLQREAKSEKEFNDKLEALQDDIIQNLIDRELIVRDFYKEKEGQTPRQIPASYIDNQISEIQITQFEGDRSKFLAYLRGRGLTLRDYRREVEEDMIYGYMRQQQRKSQSIVSPVKVETYYNENKDSFYQEDQVHLRLIQLTRAAGDSDEKLLATANEILGRFKAGEKFEDLAREYTQDAKRSKGGDWGWQKRSDLKSAFSDQLFKLEKLQCTDPILQPEGCYLLYAEDRTFAGIQPIDQVRDQIERILLQQMARDSQERWLERLRRNGYVRLY